MPMHRKWEEHFRGEPYTLKRGETTHFQATSGSFWVFLCHFVKQMEFGAIFIDSAQQDKMLVEETIFSECSTSEDEKAGSVSYMSNGDFIQDKVCYYKSTSTGACPIETFFVSVSISDQTKLINRFITVTSCGVNTSIGEANFLTNYGPLQSSNNNVTYNNCITASGYGHGHGESNLNLKFETIRNNTQEKETIVGLASARSVTILLSNIIGNKRNKIGTSIDLYGVFAFNKNANLIGCSILDNRIDPLFSVYTENSVITLSSCYSDSKTTTNGAVLSTTENIDSFFDMPPMHLSLGECETIKPIVAQCTVLDYQYGCGNIFVHSVPALYFSLSSF